MVIKTGLELGFWTVLFLTLSSGFVFQIDLYWPGVSHSHVILFSLCKVPFALVGQAPSIPGVVVGGEMGCYLTLPQIHCLWHNPWILLFKISLFLPFKVVGSVELKFLLKTNN